MHSLTRFENINWVTGNPPVHKGKNIDVISSSILAIMLELLSEIKTENYNIITDKIKYEYIWVISCDPVVEKGRMVTRTKQLTKI